MENSDPTYAIQPWAVFIERGAGVHFHFLRRHHPYLISTCQVGTLIGEL